MRFPPTNKSFLAAGLLTAAAATIVFNNRPVPVKPAVAQAADAGTPRRSAAVRIPRPATASAGSAFPGDSKPESQNFLPSLAELASASPRSAVANLTAIEDPDLLSLALAAVASGWAQVDPDATAKWVAGLPADQRGDATAGLISAWAARAPADCLAWASQQPPGNLREESLVKIAAAWGSNDPQEALTRFLTLEIDDASRRGLDAIVSQWAQDDPSVAVENLSALEKSSRRDELLQTALVSLSPHDPELAWKYSERVSNRQFMEHIRGRALQAMAQTRPQDAIQLAKTVGNSETLLAGIARGWAVTDDSAAEEWISSLPDPGLAARLRAVASE